MVTKFEIKHWINCNCFNWEKSNREKGLKHEGSPCLYFASVFFPPQKWKHMNGSMAKPQWLLLQEEPCTEFELPPLGRSRPTRPCLLGLCWLRDSNCWVIKRFPMNWKDDGFWCTRNNLMTWLSSDLSVILCLYSEFRLHFWIIFPFV